LGVLLLTTLTLMWPVMKVILVLCNFYRLKYNYSIAISDSSGLWGVQLLNSSNDVVWSYSALSSGPSTVQSPWMVITPVFTIRIVALGALTGTITVTGRAFPWTAI
ncbi:MAG: hypothetical protein ACTSQY_07450, partial [Candidatus Odinarchaeia archaeon]